MNNKKSLSVMTRLIQAFTLLLCFIAVPSYAIETITYYHTDSLGSPVAGTDSNGALLWKEDYKPYGERIRKQVESEKNTRWYTGHPEDKETGLTYAGARFYDSVTGRFLAIDPVGFSEDNLQMFNRYAYANNNPFRFIDPDGNEPEERSPGQIQMQRGHNLGNEIANALSGSIEGGYKFLAGGTIFKIFGKSLKLSGIRAPGLRNTKDRLNFRGDPNSVIRGTDVARKGGGKRAFITDKDGRIIREITPQRVKIRVTNTLPDGSVRETFRKIGLPSAGDSKILDRL